MHHRARDLTGLRVGYLTALTYAGSDGKKSFWRVRCDCGTEKQIAATELTKKQKRGGKASCGCMTRQAISAANRTHGMSQHPCFAVWSSMLARCYRPSHPAYARYGGRGIAVCKRWHEFKAFWEDMGPSYRSGLTLERVNNEAGYYPGNCRWATCKEQASNTRKTRYVDTPAGRMTATEAARWSGVPQTTLLYRLDNGCPPEQLFSPPNPANVFSTS